MKKYSADEVLALQTKLYENKNFNMLFVPFF